MIMHMPKQTIKTSQIAPAVPPLAGEKMDVTRVYAHVKQSTITSPTMLKKRKRRWSMSTAGRWPGHMDLRKYLELLTLSATLHIPLIVRGIIVVGGNLLDIAVVFQVVNLGLGH